MFCRRRRVVQHGILCGMVICSVATSCGCARLLRWQGYTGCRWRKATHRRGERLSGKKEIRLTMFGYFLLGAMILVACCCCRSDDAIIIVGRTASTSSLASSLPSSLPPSPLVSLPPSSVTSSPPTTPVPHVQQQRVRHREISVSP